MTDIIYRYVNLTELFSILHDSQLKFTQLMLMEDLNEGLGNVLSAQESFSYSWDLQRRKKIEEHHKRLKAITYISCWTQEPDLMAMWLLYSKNKDAIRIKTTKDKLKEATCKFGRDHHYLNQLDASKGSITLLSDPSVGSVKYVSFEEISQRIKDKYDRYVRECVKSIDDNISEEEKKILQKNIRDIEDDRIIDLNESSFLKDKCFLHEKELRASFRVYFRNEYSKEDWAKRHLDDINHLLGGSLIYEPEIVDLPKVIKVSINSDFIDAICFDPRMPEYMRYDMLKIIELINPNIVIEESEAFGYKLQKHDFSLIE
ncbi:hypothetical protein ADIMK_1918 [Marinobacterium lacunae]|uniref:DUF2971 domain-containing protein n=1 Tax=Marinobacterium lacunae TaxID=1232683 RepID=A0A081FZE6_9GAMM|nr:hypothetical protein [Marinobacterium lacunae]KEA63901.1 hypothetical protein ADIMK_1918 [Marinobacterium lacunae]